MKRILLALPLLLASAATPTNTPKPGFVRVQINTTEGPIVVALDMRRAPATSANFLAYVDDGRFDGTTFYRAARGKADPKKGFVQGGIRTDARRILPPFPLETTAKTGIRHTDGVISMARGQTPASAGGNFFITVGPAPAMDARPGYAGYAAFGHVVAGMETVKRILAKPSGGGMDAFKGQMILKPVGLVSAKRLDGRPKPTGQPKPWLINIGGR
ncbi:peptidylprolyl isomerase [Sphingomonas carotinifaciens]|uniref:peptidylprolyl isomerase n=1 Tax=Sphingomonas carotinifaciens TaxID=1166323 RepID=A0A1G7IK91_9SPHN|nr:peptidylprolyl isomerase [Sphingomonas carotinifaciens]MBB4084839.1 peptidyl-prolyl cis-trans isomerase A (cyclophilin A) [Sphingomonas carotinifaciens]MWC44225.1 peptidylprolyl isomerase [Sphingomonas carotinifaciens]SDF13025.1 peptidyl-prolyl cis-trans isomerase A (cyclophilin A) [Sphingomonas carotinifaciens]